VVLWSCNLSLGLESLGFVLKFLSLEFSANHCNATFSYCHEMSSVVCNTRGQTVSWIRVPLRMEVGLGPSDT